MSSKLFVVRLAKIALIGMALGLVGLPTVLQAETRTLTDKQGRSIKAVVVSVDGDKVTIKREDGQTFSLSLATLSDDDRQFLKEWAQKQAALIPAGGVEVQISRGKFDTKSKDRDAIVVSEEQWGYSVTLLNRTSKVLNGIHVDYILFVRPDMEPGKSSTIVPLKQKPGSKKLDTVDAFKSTIFRTDSIVVFKQQLKSGYIWAKTGNNAAIEDTLYGVWLRVYVGDQLVNEVCSPASISKSEQWNFK